MLDRLLGGLGASNPPSTPDPRFGKVTGPIERPRVYVGINEDQLRLTESKPPNGVYFHNLESDRLEQWVIDHWETVGQTFLGEREASGDIPLAPRPTSIFAGGSIVAVGGPPGSGGIVGPVPGPIFTQDNAFGGSLTPQTILLADPPVTLITIPIGASLPSQGQGFFMIPLEGTGGAGSGSLLIKADGTTIKTIAGINNGFQMQGLTVANRSLGIADIDLEDLQGVANVTLVFDCTVGPSIDIAFWNGASIAMFGGS